MTIVGSDGSPTLRFGSNRKLAYLMGGAIEAFADGDTTPSVNSGLLFKTANTSSTTISDFDDGTTGQEISVVVDDDNTTFSIGGISFQGRQGETVKFLYDGAAWTRVSGTGVEIVNVKDYGAAGDNATDDTAAIQAALDAAKAGDNDAQARVFIPPGVYLISSSITIDQLFGLVVQGSGIRATELRWNANDNTDNMFEITNCRNCLFEDFSVVASGATSILGACFRLRNEAAKSQAQSLLTFQNIRMNGVTAGFKYGIFWDDTGAADANNDLSTVRNVEVSNFEEYAFYINHSQSKAHQFHDCYVNNGVNAVRLAAGLRWYGGGFYNLTGAGFHITGVNDRLLVIGSDAESCDRFVDVTNGSANAFPVTLIANRFACNSLNADDKAIIYTHNGCLTLVGNIFDGASGSIIDHNPWIANTGGKDILLGNHFNVELGTDTNPFNLIGDSHSEATLAGNTFVETTGGSLAVATSLGTFADGDTTPLVIGKRRFQTANTSSTTITMLDGGAPDQEVTVVFGDGNTTIDFTGTNLKGNAGLDWSPANGDHMNCIFDGTNWYCTVSAKRVDIYNVKDYGATGDGSTDDSTAILAALAAASSGGTVFFPAGTYKWLRGDGTLQADSIASSDTIICGVGTATVIDLYKGDGTRPDNPGNEFYNAFQATDKGNITIRDMKFQGYGTPGYFLGCTNVTIDGIYHDGDKGGASNYLAERGIVFIDGTANGSNSRVVNSTFFNVAFGVNIGMSATELASNVTVSNCHFEIDKTVGNFTATFPVGVYIHGLEDIVVSNNTFKNIHSSVNDGSTGTGMGYGVYEGDGDCETFLVDGNTFLFEGNGGGNAIAIRHSTAERTVISDNIIRVQDGAEFGIYVDLKVAGASSNVVGNLIQGETLASTDAIRVDTRAAENLINIVGNLTEGFGTGIRAFTQSGASKPEVNISDNVIRDANGMGLQVIGDSAEPIIRPKIIGNTIINSNWSGIRIKDEVLQSHIVGNVIKDSDQANSGTEENSSGIYFTQAYGSHIADNYIGNTLNGGGNTTYGVTFANSTSQRIFKDTGQGNVFEGIDNTGAGDLTWKRFHKTKPTTGAYDLQRGDFVVNANPSGGKVLGWWCTNVETPSLNANASSASNSITLSSTNGIAPGDLILFLKDSTTIIDDYATATEYHQTTVASITSGTVLVINDAIDAGDGTYTAGTAFIKTARFSADQVPVTLVANDTTPYIDGGRIFLTANTSSTTISDFLGATAGQEIVVLIQDANTTIDFTSSGLKGNGGSDWSPANGDHMRCVYDGTDWFCTISDNTA